MTASAFRSTLRFIALDLILVGWIGDAAATHFGFSSNLLIPVSALFVVAAGYVGAMRGAWGATAGSAVTSIEALAYVLTGNLTPDIVRPELRSTVAVALVFLVALGGGALGALGGWLARRRHPAAGVAEQPDRGNIVR